MERNGSKRFSKAGTFIVGFLCGLLVAALLAIGLAGYLIKNPKQVLAKASDLGMHKIVSRTMQTVPRALVGKQQHVITAKVQQLTKAYADNKISQDELDHLIQSAMAAFSDQNFTEQEVDQLLKLVNQYAQ